MTELEIYLVDVQGFPILDDMPDHNQPLEVRVNGIPCSWSGLAEAEHVKASGWKEPQPRRHVYDGSLEARSKRHRQDRYTKISRNGAKKTDTGRQTVQGLEDVWKKGLSKKGSVGTSTT